MLAYFGRYKVIARLIALLGPLVVIGVILLATGANLMSGIYGGVAYLVCLVVLMIVCTRAFGAKADAEAERMLALYNQQCDPESFVDEGAPVCRAIYDAAYSGATTEVGAWFLAPYALACADLNEENEGANDASMMEQVLLNGIPETAAPAERAGILMNVEPLTLRLRGPEEALRMVEEARQLLAADGSEGAAAKLSYLDSEAPMLQALIDGDADAMLARSVSVWNGAGNPLRLRVLNADAAAGIYAAEGDTDNQRQALSFVVENGNKLPVVDFARKTLAAL